MLMDSSNVLSKALSALNQAPTCANLIQVGYYMVFLFLIYATFTEVVTFNNGLVMAIKDEKNTSQKLIMVDNVSSIKISLLRLQIKLMKASAIKIQEIVLKC